jgi:hypothetical protein
MTLLVVLAGCAPMEPADPCVSKRCPAHARCEVAGGVARCDCEPGYLGAGCDSCDETAGYHLASDGQTCTTDPCDPDPCDAQAHRVCADGACVCDGAGGYHLAGDGETCTDDPCDPNDCDAQNHELCDAGACVCDLAGGYHRASDDQTCTTDPCDPNPCSIALHQICAGGSCICSAGYHLGGDGVTCTDDPCDPDLCDASNHELCDLGACVCDAAGGYHLGGDGVTCTDALCDPDPCDALNHEVCALGQCSCDAAGGYHLSANGVTCTTDLCDPNPCDGVDQLCVGGACEAIDADPCDPALATPTLEPGAARYFRDGLALPLIGTSYRLSFPHDIITGELVLNVRDDQLGRSVEELVAAQSFPICVILDDAGDGSGYALLEDGAVSYSTDSVNRGKLAIVGQQGDALIGRFAFDARQNGGSAVTEVRAGVFSALPR